MAIDPKEFYDALVGEGLDLFAGVPDSLLKNLCACVFGNAPSERNIITANEGNAVGIACGYHVATGKSAVVYMQNSGEGNIVNPLLSIADPDVYSIPMLLVIGWRGEPGVHDEPQHVKQGKVTCTLLETMGVPHEVLDADDWRNQLASLLGTMRAESRPVAVVVRKGLFGGYPFKAENNGALLSREEALEVVLDCLGEDDLIVSTTGKTSREVFEIRERRGQGHANDFLTVGGMGHTSSIAFGMALGCNANVWCIDGDGSFLMHMGAFPVMAQKMPANFKYVLNVNGAHESVGGQPNVAQQVDVPGILRASGFDDVHEAKTVEEIKAGMKELRGSAKSALVITTHQGSRANLGRPTSTPQENKYAMMAKISAMRQES
ncbi:MAG: phosphonopyruvate decarboxylase [Eggerthellaceae bacterium]|nr:phosphonopyruvate decarboxylase [Eggerthellaceae bacterium]